MSLGPVDTFQFVHKCPLHYAIRHLDIPIIPESNFYIDQKVVQ